MSGLFDLELLNTLTVIAETGSLSAAAPRVFRSQSAVSEQVRKLEEMCGLKLLQRGKTGASLTPAGKRLVEHARDLLASSRAAYRDLQGVQLAGVLRLAITDYFRPRELPGILRRIRDRFPHLRLDVSIRQSAAIEDEASAGNFDIGLSMSIIEGARKRSNISKERMRLRREPLVWIADRSFAMPDDGVLPLVALPDTCSLRRSAIRTLESAGIAYTVAHSASGVGGLHLALRAGLGVTCLNASAVPEGAAGFADPRLPVMPEVEFNLVSFRKSEQSTVAKVRDMLAEQLNAA